MAAIICGKPCTPSVSAVGVWTSRMFAPGAIACATSTSSETSSAHPVLSSWPGPLLVGGGAFVAGDPCNESWLNLGMLEAQVTPSSPHIDGRLNAVRSACGPKQRRGIDAFVAQSLGLGGVSDFDTCS